MQVATFECSFRANGAYYDCNTTNGQAWTKAPLSFSVGDMAGDVVGATKQTVSSNPATVTGPGGFRYYAVKWPNCEVGDTRISSRDMWLSSSDNIVWNEIQFDATYPTEATMGDIVYGGVAATKGKPVDNLDGTTTVHCTFSAPDGTAGNGLSASASYPTAGEKTMTVTNVAVNVWGDETDFTPTTVTSLIWNVYSGPGTIQLLGADITRFDWLGQEKVTNDMLVNYATLSSWHGASTAYGNSQTIEVAYDTTNLDVRAITLPLYKDHGTTVTINGVEHALADVAETVDETGNYAVITAEKCGVTEIASAKIEVGKLNGGATSTAEVDKADAFSDIRLASWGSFTKGAVATNHYTVYQTGTDPTDPNNTTVVKADGTGNPTAVKKMSSFSEPNGGSFSKSALMAGDTTHFSWDYTMAPWVDSYGITSAYDATESLYLTLPAGFKASNVTLGGVAATLTDVTAEASNVPDGMVIYRIEWPAGVDKQVGYYTTDLTTPYKMVEFDLSTSPYLQAATFNIKNFVRMGTSPDAAVKASYSGSWGDSTMPDTYALNGDQTMTAPSKEFTVQPFAGVSVTNSMQVTKNGTPLDQWITYNEADPDNTCGVVNTRFQSDYKLTVKNETDQTADTVSVFVPVAKVGQDFGKAFTIEGPQQFNLSFTASTLPDGWSVQYLKMNSGVSYAVGKLPASSDYTVISDPAQADMILVTGSNGLGAGKSADITFKVTSPDDLNNYLDAVDTWGCEAVYYANGSVIEPTTTFPEQLKVSNKTLEATVTKTADKTEATVGDPVTYTITAENTGGTDLTNYFVVDYLPDSLEYVSCTGDGTYDAASATITWNIASLASGEKTTFTVVTTATAAGTTDNTVTINEPDVNDPTKPGDAFNTANAETVVKAANTYSGSSASTTPTTTQGTLAKTGDGALPLAIICILAAGCGVVLLGVRLRTRRS